MTFEIGYAQTIITPTLNRRVFLAGFGQDRVAESVHDDLYVRALALKDEKATLVLVSLDLIGFFRPDVIEVIRRVKEFEPDACIIVAATHTHHGPDTIGLWGPNTSTSGVDTVYMSALKGKIIETILTSLENISLCDEIRATTIRVNGMVKNARNPEILDDELVTLQFTNAGKPLANLFNFPCHPEVLWEHNKHITADFPGYLRQEVEKATGAPCLFFSGALGGMLTPDVKEHSFEEAEQMGKSLAFSGMLALERAELVLKSPTFNITSKNISVKLTNILYKLAFFRKLLPDVRDNKGLIHSEVNLLQIGQIWFATVPGEILPKLGLEIKSEMLKAGAKIAGVIGLANDELGYILPKEDFRYPLNPFKPGKHYEETNSIGKDIGPEIMEELSSLLGKN